MRFPWFSFSFLLTSMFLFVGCGGSNEATSIDSDELQSYVEENAAELEAEERLLEQEDAAEDEDDD